jgi:osmotically-inducible protein OsmY
MNTESLNTSDADAASLGERIHQHLHEQLEPERDLRITAAETDDAIILSGTVPSEEDRRDAARAAASLAPGKRVENLLEVERDLPDDRIQRGADNADLEPLYDDELADQSDDLNPEFTGQPLITDTLQVEDAGVEEDLEDAGQADQETTLFPPTDPVLAVNDEGNVDVLGGFAPDAMAEMGVDPSVEDNLPGDEALADAVSRELREDALTTILRIEVVVEEGIAHLRGTVPTLDDAESAEAVASRVPGVREVSEELDVAEM